jgi:hypothetical protein
MRKTTIADHQREALARPFKLGVEPGPYPLSIMRLRVGPEQWFDVLVTVDVDFPYGPHWHAAISRDPLDKANLSGVTVPYDESDDLVNTIIVGLLKDVGEGDVETRVTTDGRMYHAFRALTLLELSLISPR